MISQEKIKRVKDMFKEISGENMEIDYVKGTIYGYGTELATLKIFKRYNLAAKNKNVYQDFSPSKNSFYISIENVF